MFLLKYSDRAYNAIWVVAIIIYATIAGNILGYTMETFPIFVWLPSFVLLIAFSGVTFIVPAIFFSLPDEPKQKASNRSDSD